MKYIWLRQIIGGGRLLASLIYFKTFHKFLNWRNPQNINEKINWQKFYGDISYWPKLSDKYAVREYVKSKGLDNILVKLYGKWNNPSEIDWDSLPDSFVLKMNNGSGDVEICKNKDKADKDRIIEKFGKLFNKQYFYVNAEPHYDKITPCIIAEELLNVGKQPIPTNSLIDYKIWCFGGKVDFIWACYNRTSMSAEVASYDVHWNFHPEYSVYTDHYKKASVLIPKPECLDEMIKIAEILSEGIPQVRVDLYVVDNKVYFGEMTFTSAGGFMTFYTKEKLFEMGQKIPVPQK